MVTVTTGADITTTTTAMERHGWLVDSLSAGS